MMQELSPKFNVKSVNITVEAYLEERRRSFRGGSELQAAFHKASIELNDVSRSEAHVDLQKSAKDRECNTHNFEMVSERPISSSDLTLAFDHQTDPTASESNNSFLAGESNPVISQREAESL